MAFTHVLQVTVDQGRSFALEVAHMEAEGRDDTLVIRLRAPPDAAEEVRWVVAPAHDGYELRVASTGLVGVGVCLAGCMAGVATSALVDCLRKAKTRAQARKCLQDHGLWHVMGALSCIYGCLQL